MKVLRPGVSFDRFFGKLKEGRSLLFLDYDGTLAPFQIDPKKASPYPGVMEKLQEIVDKGNTTLVIVSGRKLTDLLPFICLNPIPELWGSHGSERFIKGKMSLFKEIEPIQKEGLEFGKKVWERCEIKPTSIALHWRGMDEKEKRVLEAKIRGNWEGIAERHHLEIHQFDGGLELRAIGINKGEVVSTVLKEHPEVKAIAYLGDDATDEEAFQVLGELGLKVLVRKEERKTLADIQITPPEELLTFLDNWNVWKK
jgi:trehalose-phosphatase